MTASNSVGVFYGDFVAWWERVVQLHTRHRNAFYSAKGQHQDDELANADPMVSRAREQFEAARFELRRRYTAIRVSAGEAVVEAAANLMDRSEMLEPRAHELVAKFETAMRADDSHGRA
jgi:hypothetical protein